MKLSARTVKTERYPIHIGEEVFAVLQKELNRYRKHKSAIFLLTDTNTLRFCLPALVSKCPELEEAIIITIDSGEENKTLRNAEYLWKELAGKHADRHAVLINLGGGMVTDLGGYVASGFHRGIDTIHIPTSMIGQIDASIGGKTGVNLDGLKNQVGTFYFPKSVYIWPGFLATLDPKHLRSGIAEVAKTALIRDEQFWRWLTHRSVEEILALPFEERFWKDLILKTIRIKLEIVSQDPFEHNQRKLLNFGHTIGHAIESLALQRDTPVLHGEAVAAGMICVSFLSVEQTGLDPTELQSIIAWIMPGFGKLPLMYEDESVRMDLMQHDKKNRQQEIRFTLLSRIGQGKINQVCDPEWIRDAFRNFYDL